MRAPKQILHGSFSSVPNVAFVKRFLENLKYSALHVVKINEAGTKKQDKKFPPLILGR